MPKLLDQRYDFETSKRTYEGCSCEEFILRFYYCRCGARQSAINEIADEIIPDLSDEQRKALTELTGAIERRAANSLGYRLERLGLSTGHARSGDNADVLTDLGKTVQQKLWQRAIDENNLKELTILANRLHQ